MKGKTIRIISLISIAVIMLTALTACAGSLKGTYETSDGLSSVTFGDDKSITLNALGLVDVEGTYEIEDGNITVDYVLPVIGTKTQWVKTFEKDGKTIIIDGKEFTKVSD